jgi:hypothetical protein
VTGVALLAAKGSPGVTTTAVLLAAVWPAPAVLLEADPAGGDLRCWYADAAGQPLRPDLGVVSLLAGHQAARMTGTSGLAAHTQTLPGGLPVVVGPSSPVQAEALRGAWPQLAAAITAHDADVLVDLGCCRGPDSQVTDPVLGACDQVLLVCRGSVASVLHTRDLLAQLQQRSTAEVLLIGTAADRDDVARALGAPRDQVHLLPHDAAAAAALAGAWTRKLDRSPLVAAVRHLAARIHERQHRNQQTPRAVPDQPVMTAVSS